MCLAACFSGAAVVLFPVHPLSGAEKSAVYFWHRERNAGTDEVLTSCAADWQIYALRGEFRKNEGGRLLRAPASVRSIPVFRLDAEVWREEFPEKGAGENSGNGGGGDARDGGNSRDNGGSREESFHSQKTFTERFAEILRGEQSPEIQIDCDVPESRLRDYAEFLKRLRARVPDKGFSVTLLPCHLRHREELEELFPLISFYVLQLHALERPPDLPSEYRLFDSAAAEKALRQALDLGKTFRMALPCYAYRLHYSERTGRFLRLSAENRPPRGKGEIIRFAVPDWEELLRFRKRHPDIRVVWFRLPMPGDRLCLELENLRRLDGGSPPLREIETTFRTSGSRTDIFWTNHGIPGEEEYTQILGGGKGEAFFFHGIHPVSPTVPGCVPESIRGIIPKPGETLKTGEIHQWIPSPSD